MRIASVTALLVAVIGLFPHQSIAQSVPGFSYIACNEMQCQLVSCGPNGCSVIATWPRPREVSGE
jgi:hypothetical protein